MQENVAAVSPAHDYAQALEQADQEIVEIIAGMFLEGIGAEMAELAEACRMQDAVLLQRLAHTLKGNFALFNAEPARQLAATLEAQAACQQLGGAEALLAAIQTEIDLLCPCLWARLAR